MENAQTRTIQYYSQNACTLASRYECVHAESLLADAIPHLKPNGKVLDLGCGSGRDAAMLLAQGFDVTALDGSEAMIHQATQYHPELAGRLMVHELPAPLPFNDNTFDAVIAIAVLLHFPMPEMASILQEIRRNTKPSGRIIYSVNTTRPGLDHTGIDSQGRYFNVMNRNQWEHLNRAAGFETIQVVESDDAIGRSGVRWISFVLAKDQRHA